MVEVWMNPSPWNSPCRTERYSLVGSASPGSRRGSSNSPRGVRLQPAGDDRQRQTGPRRGQPELGRELGRQPLVVVVEQRDPGAPGVADPGVTGGRRATGGRQLDQPQPLVGEQVGQRRPGHLVGAVDHHDDFEVGQRLGERAAYRTGYQLGP